MAYLIIHGLSYLIRTYFFTFPEINLFGLDPTITELLILNAGIYSLAYPMAGIHYRKGYDPYFVGSIYYFMEYCLVLGLLWVTVFLTNIFNLPNLYALIATTIITLFVNFKISSII